MSYVIKSWNSRKVHVVRDGKGKFSKRFRVSGRTMNSLVAIMLLVTLWCLGFFLHILHATPAHAESPYRMHSMEQMCAYAKENPYKIVNLKELLAECANPK